ncbi:MAG: hypothetical protein KIG16_03890 [Eubacteriales bacterium]|nr:hypothetical protein [Eubacteriales bacterium]
MKAIQKDKQIITEKIHSADYIKLDYHSTWKKMAALLQKMESLLMELKPYLSATQFIDLMREESIPTELCVKIEKIVPKLYRENSEAGRKALELYIFLDEIVVPDFCGAWELEDFSYTLHALKNPILKEATQKCTAEVQAKNYLKITKGTTPEQTLHNEEVAINQKIDELKTALKPALPNRVYTDLAKASPEGAMEILGCVIPELYADNKTTAFNTAIELRTVIDCLYYRLVDKIREEIDKVEESDIEDLFINEDCCQHKCDCCHTEDSDDEIEMDEEKIANRENYAKEQALYDSYVKDYTSAGELFDFEDYEPYQDVEEKTYQKFCKQFQRESKQLPTDWEERRQAIQDEVNRLKADIKPYLTTAGYKKLLATNSPFDIQFLLQELGTRLLLCGKTDCVVPMAKLHAYAQTIVDDFAMHDLPFDECESKVLAEDYLGTYDSYNDAVYQKMHELKTALKPYMEPKKHREFLLADPLNTLLTVSGLINELYYDKHDKAATTIAIELRKLVQCRVVECYRYDF